MTDTQFTAWVSEASSYANREPYISNLCPSSMWGDAEGADVPAERIEALSGIWHEELL